MISVRKLDTANRQDVNAWVNLPYRLYAGNPYWVPEMIGDAKQALDRRKNPFLLHSEADFFVAEKNGGVVGRVAVMENTRYNAMRDERTAFFHLFESIEDFAVAEALFGAAFEWSRARGLDKMMGPKGFITMDNIGMLVKGFDLRPAIGIAYNPSYYPEFMERLGFVKETDFNSGYLPGRHYQLSERIIRIADKVKNRYGFRVEGYASKKELLKIVPDIIDAYNATFTDNWEFVPITPEEGDVIRDRVMQILDPKLIRLVWKEDVLVGFIIIYPDISEGLQRSGGKLLPLGWFHLLREFGRTKWVNLNGAGILEQYRARGVDAMMFVEIYKVLQEAEFDHAEVVQIREGITMFVEMTKMGIDFYKMHRVYKRTL